MRGDGGEERGGLGGEMEVRRRGIVRGDGGEERNMYKRKRKVKIQRKGN